MRIFKRYTLIEYIAYLRTFVGRVRFSQVHMHHTWVPTHANWRSMKNKMDVITGMYRYHTDTREFNDIAQHATIDPEGYIWEGRSLLMPPASATNYNDSDNDRIHPFMFEMIGNFDKYRDNLEGAQLETVNGLVNEVMLLWGSELKFHRDMTNQKSCPGTGITKDWFLSQLKEDECVLKVEDADKIIKLLGAVWQVTDTPTATNEGQNEVGRLANELRKASGQSTI